MNTVGCGSTIVLYVTDGPVGPVGGPGPIGPQGPQGPAGGPMLRTVDGMTTITPQDGSIRFDASDTPFLQQLPMLLLLAQGQLFWLIKNDDSENAVTFFPADNDSFFQDFYSTLTFKGQRLLLQADVNNRQWIALEGQIIMNTFALASGLTAIGASPSSPINPGPKTFQASMTVTAGAGAAAVNIEGSLDGQWWDVLATLNITDTASDSTSLASAAYSRYRANVTAINGATATVKVNAGA